jgi:acyl carrier protein
MDNIAQKLIALTEHYSGVSAVTLDMTLRKDLELDSLSLTELIVACEDEFNVEIDMDHPMTVNAKTLKDLCDGIIFLKGSDSSHA